MDDTGPLRTRLGRRTTATWANHPVKSDDRRAHRLVTDPHFSSDLFERHALPVQPRSFTTPKLVQATTAHLDTCLSGEAMNGGAVYPEPPHQLTDRHALGVLLGQSNPIRDTQTGLRTRRILRDRAAHILDRLTLRTRRRAP